MKVRNMKKNCIELQYFTVVLQELKTKHKAKNSTTLLIKPPFTKTEEYSTKVV